MTLKQSGVKQGQKSISRAQRGLRAEQLWSNSSLGG